MKEIASRLNLKRDPVRQSCSHTLGNKMARVAWGVMWRLCFRPSPRPFHFWRRWMLRAFGAQIAAGAHIYPSAKIWAPWNLQMEEHSCLADHVDCYCVDVIHLGAHSTVSQYSFLCAASHDYTQTEMPLTTAPIYIGPRAWVCADVFIAPGVTVGEGSVVGARSSVFASVPPWVVAAGNPAKPLKARVLEVHSQTIAKSA